MDRPMSAPMSGEDMSSDAAKARAKNMKKAAASAAYVRDMAQIALGDTADLIKDLPTDLPHSESVKDAYNDLFKAVRDDDWERAESLTFELGVMALGWHARIRLAHLREAGTFDPRRRCGECNALIPYSSRGRPKKLCAQCSKGTGE